MSEITVGSLVEKKDGGTFYCGKKQLTVEEIRFSALRTDRLIAVFKETGTNYELSKLRLVSQELELVNQLITKLSEKAKEHKKQADKLEAEANEHLKLQEKIESQVATLKEIDFYE